MHRMKVVPRPVRPSTSGSLVCPRRHEPMMEPRRDLPTRYVAAEVEPAIYDRWLAADAFRPADEPRLGAAPFVIIQPPPNVTGALHLGHAARTTVEDTLIRYHRMRGDDTLWLPS